MILLTVISARVWQDSQVMIARTQMHAPPNPARMVEYARTKVKATSTVANVQPASLDPVVQLTLTNVHQHRVTIVERVQT